METLLLLTYAAICIFIFKVFKVPLNKWTVPTAVLGGIVLVGGLVLLMNYNHPFTNKVRQVYVVTPLVSEVRARVLEVPVKANTRVKQGEPLVVLDSTRFEARVAQLEAQLADMGQLAQGNVAAVAQARAKVSQATAERDQALHKLRRYEGAPTAFSKQQIDTQFERTVATSADLDAAKAALAKAEAAVQKAAEKLAERNIYVFRMGKIVEEKFDLDNFKAINDKFGHAAGDRVLRDFAGLLENCCRKADLYARLSGDEFVILFTDLNTSASGIIKQRLLLSFSDLPNSFNNQIELSFSYGIADFSDQQPCSLTKLLSVADSRMYAEKAQKKAR